MLRLIVYQNESNFTSFSLGLTMLPAWPVQISLYSHHALPTPIKIKISRPLFMETVCWSAAQQIVNTRQQNPKLPATVECYLHQFLSPQAILQTN